VEQSTKGGWSVSSKHKRGGGVKHALDQFLSLVPIEAFETTYSKDIAEGS
jgi:hypothetical protein